ncbi:MAG: DUF4837 family protein [Bacteroidales bacterium]|nr:DUF4837 family protein [Bacteroidales bacterium]
MKKIVKGIGLMVLVGFALMGCSGKHSVFRPTASGRPYEMMVIMDNAQWESPAGRALFDVLDTDVPGLPQPERSFRISQIAPEGFDRIIKICRNIITADINPAIYTQTKLKFSRDVYAHPQIIMTIQSPSEDEFQQYVSSHAHVILDFFNKVEINRQIAALKGKHSRIVSEKVGEIFGSDLWVPESLDGIKTGRNFLWASDKRATANQNVVVYSYPYTDKDTFTKDHFVQMRDSVMRENMPGEREGSYMTTADSRFVDVRDFALRGEYAFEARGLWEVKGDMMGGPFVSQARVDVANGRVVVVEGFVFSPDKAKRNLMRQMEASLYTLRLPAEQHLEEITVTPSGVEENQ